MTDEEHSEDTELHNPEEKLHNSGEGGGPEESLRFLARVNRLLNESFAKNAPVRGELARKAGEWGLKGRDLERRKAEALESLLQLERERLHTDSEEQLSFKKGPSNDTPLTARKGLLRSR